MDNAHAYLTIRYFQSMNGTKYKIVSDNHLKYYVVSKLKSDNNNLQWVIIFADYKFKLAYDFVQEELKNGR